MRIRFSLLVIAVALVAAGCGSNTGIAAVELVEAEEAAQTIAANSEVVILDIRTPEEFAGGHIDGAVNIDFYANDFAAQLAQLDPNASYVMYCRSGNRSEQAASLMKDLEFTAVDEIDGGILSWASAGLPVYFP